LSKAAGKSRRKKSAILADTPSNEEKEKMSTMKNVKGKMPKKVNSAKKNVFKENIVNKK
jgi:hypothetical protein